MKPQDGFITLTNSVKDDLLKFMPEAKCKDFPHPLYDHFGKIEDKKIAREKMNLPANKKLLLYFGYIRDYKGLDILIETISKLPEDYHLILAGESYGDFTPYLDLISTFNAKDKITLLNRYIPDHEVSLLFSAADVCVLSYKSATQSGVTSISLHYELPLVVTNVGGLKEMVEHEKTGLVVERAEANLVTEQLLNYFTKYDLNIFKENIRKMKEELSWKRFAEKIIGFSEEL
jgi:glycosyltransferase involved in cell wall biosynthesis